MSYKVTFRDKTEIILPDAAGEILKEHLLGLKRPTNVEIGGDMYSSSLIVSVAKANLNAGPANQALAEPKFNCVLNGTSIQAEIHRRAMQHKNWPKLVQDKAWRSRTRQEIILEDPDKEWCDYLAGAHACFK